MTTSNATATEGGQPPDVALTINGLAVNAHPGMSLVEAAWHGGVPQVTSVGCLEGVCGSCRVMMRRGKDVTVGLGCQTFVEDSLEVVFLGRLSRHFGDLEAVVLLLHARFHV